jgi:hypothetical protein
VLVIPEVLLYIAESPTATRFDCAIFENKDLTPTATLL